MIILTTGLSSRAKRGIWRVISPRVRAAAIAGLFGLVVATPAEAQEWIDSRYPYITTGANDFPMVAARFAWTRPVDDYLSPLPYAGNLYLDAGASFNASYFLTAQYRAPGLKDGWRYGAAVGLFRESRFGYFGLGNDTEFDEDLVNDDQPFFYRMRRKRALVNVEVTRRIVPHLQVSGALGFERSLLSDLPGPSVFRTEFPGEVKDDDLADVRYPGH
jgi:hypothetical protein